MPQCKWVTRSRTSWQRPYSAYVAAFARADRVILAPLGRANVPEAERLDLAKLAKELGPKASVSAGTDAILACVAAEAQPGDTVVLLSNGAFGGLHDKLLAALETDAP